MKTYMYCTYTKTGSLVIHLRTLIIQNDERVKSEICNNQVRINCREGNSIYGLKFQFIITYTSGLYGQSKENQITGNYFIKHHLKKAFYTTALFSIITIKMNEFMSFSKCSILTNMSSEFEARFSVSFWIYQFQPSIHFFDFDQHSWASNWPYASY